MKHYDGLVIGFGKGGKTLAGALAGAGKTVAVAEQSPQMYGGTCINVGCIPSKSLITSARRSYLLGGGFEDRARRYAAAIAQKRRLTAALRQKNYDKLAKAAGVEVYTGRAAFTGPHTVRVALGSGEAEIEADNIFINTGARPFLPPIPGLAESRRVVVSETLMELERLPRHLCILGGGYIGVEFASMYRGFGSEVTVVQNEAAFLPREDEEIAAAVLRRLQGLGVRVLFSAQAKAVRETADGVVLSLDTPAGPGEVAADTLLVATGRRPNTEGLNLAAAGVALTPRGAVAVDAHLRTSVPHIWAMGDVTGGLQFTYISHDDFRIVKSQLLGDGGRTTENRGAVPYSVFLDPPFSRVGLTEKEAEGQGRRVKTFRLPAAAIPKAQVLGQPEGLLKAVVEEGTGKILGAHLFCAESHEVVNLLKLAIDAGVPYTALRDGIYTHPTMSEALIDLFSAAQ